MRHARKWIPLAVLFGLLALPIAFLLQSDPIEDLEQSGGQSDRLAAGSSPSAEAGGLQGAAENGPAARPGAEDRDVQRSPELNRGGPAGSGWQSTPAAVSSTGSQPSKSVGAKPVTHVSPPPPPSFLEQQAALDREDDDPEPRSVNVLEQEALADAAASAGLPPVLAPLNDSSPQPRDASANAHEHDIVLRVKAGYGTRGALGFSELEMLANRAPGPVDLTVRFAFDPAYTVDRVEQGSAAVEAGKQVTLLRQEEGMAVFQISGGQQTLSSGVLFKLWFQIPETAEPGTALRVESIQVGMENCSVLEVNDSMVLE